jgi:hypothetical protein
MVSPAEGGGCMLRWVLYLLWVAPALVFTLLAILMVRRGTRRQFPFFFSYVIFQIISFAVQFYVYHRHPQQYFYVYWPLAALSIGIAFTVIYEVFRELFGPFEALRDFGNVLFRWAVLVLLAIAVLMAMTAAPASQGSRAFALVISLERSVRAMQCGMVLLMVLCAPRLGLRYAQRVFGIALGFGLIAACDLIGVAIVARIGLSADRFNSLVHMSVYNLAALLWTGYFLAPEPGRLPVTQLAHTDRWNFALASMLNPEGNAPAVPMIVDAVDRVWNRSSGNSPRHADQ